MPKIVHEVENKMSGFKHRLVVDDVAGDWTGYIGIATNGEYRAVIQNYWGTDVPRVYTMVPVEHTIKDVN